MTTAPPWAFFKGERPGGGVETAGYRKLSPSARAPACPSLTLGTATALLRFVSGRRPPNPGNCARAERRAARLLSAGFGAPSAPALPFPLGTPCLVPGLVALRRLSARAPPPKTKKRRGRALGTPSVRAARAPALRFASVAHPRAPPARPRAVPQWGARAVMRPAGGGGLLRRNYAPTPSLLPRRARLSCGPLGAIGREYAPYRARAARQPRPPAVAARLLVIALPPLF